MRSLGFLAVIVALVCLGKVFADDDGDVYTIRYNVDNFDEEIGKQNHFVMFYAPWCGHCKRLHPTWEELAEMLNQEESNVKIAKVDCTTDGDVCNAQDVTGYPTLKFFKLGSEEGIKFRGTRDLPSLTTFITEQVSLTLDGEQEAKIPVEAGLTELTEDTFEQHVASGKHFVKFYAPWCGHCQRLAPVWDELGKNLGSIDNVRISKIDCTQHKNVCNQFDIKGYPTLLWIEDGRKIEKYQGQRALDDLVSYASKMSGGAQADKDGGDAPAVKEDASNVITLSGENFEQGVASGFTFVKFFAPWCGHCKRLAPTWDELGKKFIGHPDVDIVKVDCTLEDNKELCNEQEVDGFPSVFLFKNGKRISEYNGNRSLEDLYEFVQQHLSAHDEL